MIHIHVKVDSSAPANIYHREPKGEKITSNCFISNESTTHIATKIFNHKDHNAENGKFEHEYEVVLSS